MAGKPEVKRTAGKGYISDEVHKQANKLESPVVNELLVAARKGNVELVTACLARGGAHSVVDRHGRNCLQLACLHGHYKVALAILQSNRISIDSSNKRGLTVLHDASTEGHTRIALLLLSMGADVLARTKDGWTCLMCACSNGHIQLAKILIAAGCDINAMTSIGLTALHVAAWKGQAEAIGMLIRAGCHVGMESKNGKTALQLAQEEDQGECVTILQAATDKDSEKPEYRVLALESQLRLTQDQLAVTKSEYELMLAQEREQSKEAIDRLSSEKETELTKAKDKLQRLDAKVAELQALLKQSMNSPPPVLSIDPSTPSTSSGNRKATKKKEKESAIETMLSESRERSASFSNLTTEDAPQKGGGRKLSTDTSSSSTNVEKRGSFEKRSITELVTESLLNPSSMAAIRQELKADNLTPKIQRKIKNATNQATLPSLSDSSSPSSTSPDRSPKLTNRGSPRGGSPSVRPQWTNPALKDSAI